VSAGGIPGITCGHFAHIADTWANAHLVHTIENADEQHTYLRKGHLELVFDVLGDMQRPGVLAVCKICS
jgi:hypothetical protein